jgi:ornithine decarboxylase
LLLLLCTARYAVAHGVQKTTFDTPSELHKIAQLNPRFKCVLRIRCDDPTAKCPLGEEWHVQQLLAVTNT